MLDATMKQSNRHQHSPEPLLVILTCGSLVAVPVWELHHYLAALLLDNNTIKWCGHRYVYIYKYNMYCKKGKSTGKVRQYE